MTDMVSIMRDGEIVQVPADTVFTPVEPGPAPVPQAVSRAQAKIALSRAGYLNQAKALIEAIPGSDGDEARIWWNEAETFRFDHPLVDAMCAQLDPPITPEGKEQLFRDAEQVQ